MPYLVAFVVFAQPVLAQNVDEKPNVIKVFAEVYEKPNVATGVEVLENQDGFEVKLPEIIKKNEGRNVENKIPAHVINLTKNGSFLGHNQYGYSTTAVPRLQALLFKIFNFIPGLGVQSFEETADLVPNLNYYRNYLLKISDLHLFEADEITKAKQNIARIGNFKYNLLTGEAGNKVNFKLVSTAENLTVLLPIANIAIQHLDYKAVMNNAEIQHGNPYPVLAKDATYVAKIDNAEISTPSASLNVAFNLLLQGKITANEANNTSTVIVALSLKDIDIKTSVLAENKPTDISFKMIINDLNYEKIVEIEKLRNAAGGSEKTKVNQEPQTLTQTGEAENLDNTDTISGQRLDLEQKRLLKMQIQQLLLEALQNAKIKYSSDIIFTKGSLKVIGNAKFIGDKVMSKAEVKIVNFDEISPDYEAVCRQKLQASPLSFPPECLKISLFSALRPYLKLNERVIDDKGNEIDRFLIDYDGENAKINGMAFKQPPG